MISVGSQRLAGPGLRITGALLAVSLAAWLVTWWLADPEMRVGLLTGQEAAMPSMGLAAMGLGLFLVTWVTMMAAMMLPAVTPVARAVHGWVVRTGRSRSTSVLFIAGYLALWGCSGLAAYVGLVALQQRVAPGDPGAVRLGAVLLIVAGLYQLTPLKYACLRRCRSPLAVLVQQGPRLTRGPAGAWSAGMRHGLICLGCCWALMLVLALLGMMNLLWMVALAAAVFVEKTSRHGAGFGVVLGMLMVGFGIALVIN